MRKVLFYSIGIALIVGGLAIFLLMKSDIDKPMAVLDTPVTVEENSTANSPMMGTGSMNSILARAENLECTVSYKASLEEEVATEGTFFTSRNRLRGDFLVNSTGSEQLLSSVILKEDYLYTWTEIEGEKYGMKIALKDLALSKSAANAPEVREVVPLEAEVSYKCMPWLVVDGSIFETPTDIIFKDYADLMDVGMEFGTVYENEVSIEEKERQCSLCNQVTGQGKAECLAAFSCE